MTETGTAPSYMTHAAKFSQPAAGQYRPPLDGPAGQWATDIVTTIKHASATAPRSLQRELGPSELGTPCMRRLGYRMLEWPVVNTDSDPWPAMVGTGIHALIAAAYQQRNTELGRHRYLVEHQVTLPGISALTPVHGHCDLYDRDTGDVVDWKTTGVTSLKKYRKDGPGSQYRTQAHLYGLGMQLAGETPQNVVIVFLPRSSRLSDLHAWSEPYDPSVATAAIRRYQQLYNFHVTFDPERTPANWALLPTGDAYCSYCPWHSPGSTDLTTGCPGHNPK